MRGQRVRAFVRQAREKRTRKSGRPVFKGALKVKRPTVRLKVINEEMELCLLPNAIAAPEKQRPVSTAGAYPACELRRNQLNSPAAMMTTRMLIVQRESRHRGPHGIGLRQPIRESDLVLLLSTCLMDATDMDSSEAL